MTDTLVELCRLLSKDPLSIHDVAAHLGSAIEARGAGLGLVVRATEGAFEVAVVVPLPGSDTPHLVQLEVADEDALRLADLRGALGDYELLKEFHAYDADPHVGFHVDYPGLPYTCLVMVEVKPGPGGVADGSARAIEVRRDPRLD